MAKEWAKSFYNSNPWKNLRMEALKRDRFRCTICGRTATEVHHTVELTRQNINDPKVSLNINLIQSLCGVCHKQITKQMKRKSASILEDIVFDDNGYPISASPPGDRK